MIPKRFLRAYGWLSSHGVSDRVVIFTALAIASGITFGRVAGRQREAYEDRVAEARRHRGEELDRLASRVRLQDQALAEAKASRERAEEDARRLRGEAAGLREERTRIAAERDQAKAASEALARSSSDAVAALSKALRDLEGARREFERAEQEVRALQARRDEEGHAWEARLSSLEASRTELTRRLGSAERDAREWRVKYETLREQVAPGPGARPAPPEPAPGSSSMLEERMPLPEPGNAFSQLALCFEELAWGSPGPEPVRGDRGTWGDRIEEDFTIAGRCFRNAVYDFTIGADQRVRDGRVVLRGRVNPNGRVGLGEGLADLTAGTLADLFTLGKWNPVSEGSEGTHVPVLGAVYTAVRGALSSANATLNTAEGAVRGTLKLGMEAPLDVTVGAWHGAARGVSALSNSTQAIVAFAKSSAPGGPGWVDTHLGDWNRLKRGDPRGLPIISNLFNGDRLVRYRRERLVLDHDRWIAAADDNVTKTVVRKILETAGF